MRIMHVYRGYGSEQSNPVVNNQIQSITKLDNKVSVIPFILPKGGITYLKYIFKLRKEVKKNRIDLIHAHYSFSCFLASLSGLRVPVICSLMGSDVLDNNSFRIIIKFFNKYSWSRTIVKTNEMKKLFHKVKVIPNGVDFDNFSTKDKDDSYYRTGFDRNKINIIFIAVNPRAKVKNIELAEKAIKLLNNDRIILHSLSTISFVDLPYYYSIADLLLLTSLSEGSPNVIKEAMACNCPIVSTDVGDVSSIVKDTDGCYITTFDSRDVANKINAAIEFGKRTNGREMIKSLDSDIISERLIELYKSCLK